jgi:predicted MPP superfamily phosphohydrolase
MKFRITRRKFILAARLAVPGAMIGHARFIEPNWLPVRKFRLSKDKPTHRFIHFTELVKPGIGWFPVPLRFNCRPEITVFEV